MINSLFISKTGMEAQQTQLDVISHNLANVSTTGYKRASAVFEDLIYQNLRQSGAQTTEQNQLPTGLHRSEEHTSELQSPCNLVCRLLLEKKKKTILFDVSRYTSTPLSTITCLAHS